MVRDVVHCRPRFSLEPPICTTEADRGGTIDTAFPIGLCRWPMVTRPQTRRTPRTTAPSRPTSPATRSMHVRDLCCPFRFEISFFLLLPSSIDAAAHSPACTLPHLAPSVSSQFVCAVSFRCACAVHTAHVLPPC